ASVRKAVTLDDGSAVILSVAKYYSPSGKAIQDTGVMPQTLLPEPESQVELDEDGNPVTPDDADSTKKAKEEYLKKAIDSWKGR
ncbi:MAG: carboxyl-terminal protease, partial [Bryobacteraceae bacterium]